MAPKKRSRATDSYYGDIGEGSYPDADYKPSFYGDEEEKTGGKESILEKIEFFLEDRKNQVLIPVGIVAAIVILLVLSNFFQAPSWDGSPLTDKDGNSLTGTILHFSSSGELKKTTNSSGGPLKTTMVSGDGYANTSFFIKTGELAPSKAVPQKAEAKSSDGTVWFVEDVSIDENGQISFNLFPPDDLPPGEYDLNVSITILDPETGDTTVITIPVHVTIHDYFSSGCLSLNKTTVKESAHFGTLETDFKLKISCEAKADLNSYVVWNSAQVGTVEVVMQEKSGTITGRTLSLSPAPLKNSPPKGDYSAKIIFTPFPQYAGQQAKFSVMFGSDENAAGINFDVALENLEQCVSFSKSDLIITKENEDDQITLDVSKCSSNSISFYVCDGDPGCTGGASEGSIEVSDAAFSLSPRTGSKKTITVSKGDIPGVYGLTFHANVPGYKKVFVAEKEVFIEPSDEMLKPDKFVISLLGKGAKDSIRVSNPSLAEDIHVNASICDIYANAGGAISSDNNSSSGDSASDGSTSANSGASNNGSNTTSNYTGGSGWWNNLGKEAGVGKYQASLAETLNEIDRARATAQAFSAPRNALIKQAYLDSVAAYKESIKIKQAAEDAIAAAQKAVDSFDEGTDYSKTMAKVQLALALTDVTTQEGLAVTNEGLISALNSTLITTNTVQAATLPPSLAACSYYLSPFVIDAGVAWGKTLGSVASMGTAHKASTFEGIVMILQATTDLMQVVDSIITLSEGDGKASAEETLELAEESLDSANVAVESSENAVSYSQKALEAAAIDAFYSASGDDLDAKKYLEMAKGAHEEAITNLEAATEKINGATEALDDLKETNDFGMSQIIDVIDGIAHITDVLLVSRMAALSTAVASLKATQANMIEFNGNVVAVDSVCVMCCTPCKAAWEAGEACPCCPISTVTTLVLIPSIATVQSKLSVLHASLDLEWVAQTMSIFVAAADTFSVFSDMTEETSVNIDGTKSAYDSTISTYSNAIDAHQKAIDSIDVAIQAADELAGDEASSSDAATYNSSSFAESGYNKKRLAGLIASAVSHGYIAGAYEGGVYNTYGASDVGSGGTGFFSVGTISGGNKISLADYSDSSGDESDPEQDAEDFISDLESDFKQDCANRVDLGLTDYVINLVKDGEPIGVSNDKVSASWSSSDAKVFDVFEKQEVGVIFSNNGLQKNGYGTVTLSATKHIHGPLAGDGAGDSNDSSNETGDEGITVRDVPTGARSDGIGNDEGGGNVVRINGQSFGPFNVPDASTETVTKKFHFKFNATPRTTAAGSAKTTGCSNGLMFASNGKDALSNVNLSWKWNEVDDSKYLDAAQLSIVLSKKLTDFDELLRGSSASCPENPSMEILQEVKPSEFTVNPLKKCYLPLTTKLYDGKPALYYFFENGGVGWTEKVKSQDDLENLLNFKVKLMRDGYGTNFEKDFAQEYTTKIIISNDAFTNPNSGISKYFKNASGYYSSEANGFSSSSKYVVPDAGEYAVRILADLKENSLFSSGEPSAKIVFALYPVKPINDSFSVLYYTPFDGSVGMGLSSTVVGGDGNAEDQSVIITGASSRDGYGFGISGGASDYLPVDNGGSVISPGSSSLVNVPYYSSRSLFELNSLNSLRGKIFDYKYVFTQSGKADSNSFAVFTPSFATPLALSTHADSGNTANLLYEPMQDTQILQSSNPGFMLLTGLGGCRDFYGVPLQQQYRLYPDSKIGDYYGLKFGAAQDGGDIFFKTIVYSPVTGSYAVQPAQGTSLYTLAGSYADLAELSGISGMAFNDQKNNSYIRSVADLFAAVKGGDVCSANLGNRIVFFWNEGRVSSVPGSNGQSLSSREDSLSAGCIK